MQLLWSPRSPFVRKVMIVAHETGLVGQIETVRAVASMAKVNPEILQHNPLGKIPVLLTADAGPLFDSRVICEYLDGLHSGPPIFPVDRMKRFAALRRAALGDGLLDVLLLLRNEAGRPDGVPSKIYLAGFEQKIGASLAALEQEATALDAAEFDIGHVSIGCALGYLDFRFGERDWRRDCPRLANWHARFEARPSAIATLPGDEATA